MELVWDEVAYLYVVLRTLLVAGWLVAMAGFARLATMQPPGQRGTLAAATALLMLAALLSAHEGYYTFISNRHRPIHAWAWLWTGFDGLAPVFCMLLLRTLRQRDAALARLAALAVTDTLTGLPNRRGFQERAAPALLAARRRSGAAALLTFDLDRFKAINDGFGHAAGDVVLRGVATALASTLRAGDVSARFGGEEFVALLPDTSLAAAQEVAERLRTAIRASVPHPAGPDGVVTVSIGVAPVGEGEPEPALLAALAAADAALYRAKQAGRDRVEVAEPDGPAAMRPAA
ncbi:MAG: GGDEF domain-containing protein [Acetobacteraceae bacterium]|nr:GGDEF domain-containing protein [Acetobacteraceae bacterium]